MVFLPFVLLKIPMVKVCHKPRFMDHPVWQKMKNKKSQKSGKKFFEIFEKYLLQKT